MATPSTTDTIVAIATARARAALGLVRLSGPQALSIVSSLVGRDRPLEPRRATFARIVPGVRTRDEVVVTWFPAPRSYTGDDCVEITAHGAPLLLDAIVSAAVSRGARRATPGEFTLRAFVNGRVDLTQAEAVADLTAAVTPEQARAAFEQLEGSLGRAIAELSAALFDLAASVEASLDFPEEGYHFTDRATALDTIAGLRERVAELLAGAERGCVLREGATIALTGRPNTGKSSLFNRLLRIDRAIVSPEAGTTRDVLIEALDLNGIPVQLIDTAGQRAAANPIESEGVRRAATAAANADVELLILDGSEPLTPEDRRLLDSRSPRRLVLANKCDLPAAWEPAAAGTRTERVSAHTGEGLRDVLASVERLLGGGSRDESPRVTNSRHVERLRSAEGALVRATDLVKEGAPEELVLVELHAARASFEEVTGVRSSDDLLAHIFERFCIGK